MTIHRVGGYGATGGGSFESGGFESSEARIQFGKLVNLVAQPGTAFKVEQPMFHGKLRQDPPGIYQFRVTQHNYAENKPSDTVTFSATTSKDGRFIELLRFEKDGVVVTPSQPIAQDIFWNRVIKPIYGFLFGD